MTNKILEFTDKWFKVACLALAALAVIGLFMIVGRLEGIEGHAHEVAYMARNFHLR